MAALKYAVVGNPIKHSKSPQIHSAFAQQEGIDIDYQRIATEEKNFFQTVKEFNESGGLGLNITVPFKVLAYEQCEKLSDFAKAAQAVNTISFNEQREWLGTNTDGVGLLRDLTVNQKLTLTNKKILVLGAGGSTRGILLPLLNENPNALVIVNRNVEKARTLVKAFSHKGNIEAYGYHELGDEAFDLVINATSTSLNNTLPPLPDYIVNSESVCYDLYYSDSDTNFMKWANNLNVSKSCDGLGMLIEQAAESYFIWRGFRPETRSVLQLLRQ